MFKTRRAFALGFFLIIISRPALGAALVVSIPIQLTHAQNFDAAPSPDGKKLVLISKISAESSFLLWTPMV